MKLPRRKFLHLVAGAPGSITLRLGANLSDAAGAHCRWLCCRRLG
jgi:hypothetical protein